MSRTTLLVFLLACSLVLSACGGKKATPVTAMDRLPDAVAESIDQSIDDPVRAQAAKDEATKLDYAIRDYVDELWKLRVRAYYQSADYHADAEDFGAILDQVHELRETRQRQIIEIALEGRKAMSEAEWAEFHAALAEKLGMAEESRTEEDGR